MKDYKIGLIIMLLLAFVFRVQSLDVSDHWFDESFTLLMSQESLSYIWSGVDVHPSLYYTFIKGWSSLLGYDPLVQRSFNLIIGLYFLISLYYVVTKLKSEKVAFITVSLATFSLTYIKYSVENRMYMLACLFMLWTYYFFVTGQRWKHVLFFVLSLYTHYYTFFFVLFVLFNIRSKQSATKWFRSYINIFIFCIPLLFIFYNQIKGMEGLWLQSPSMSSYLSSISYYFFIPNTSNFANLSNIFYYLFIFSIIGLIFYKTRFNELNNGLLFIGFVIPLIVLLLAVSSFSIPYHHRFVLIFGFALYILLADALDHLSKHSLIYLVAFFFVFSGVEGIFKDSYYKDADTELQSITKFVIENNICPSKIAHESPFSMLPLTVYLNECDHYLITNLTLNQGRTAGFSVIPEDHINQDVDYDYYIKSQFNYLDGDAILSLNGIELIKVSS